MWSVEILLLKNSFWFLNSTPSGAIGNCSKSLVHVCSLWTWLKQKQIAKLIKKIYLSWALEVVLVLLWSNLNEIISTAVHLVILYIGGQRLLNIFPEELTMKSRIIGELGCRNKQGYSRLIQIAQHFKKSSGAIGCQHCLKK